MTLHTTYLSGWLSPDGELFDCPEYGHCEKAEEMGHNDAYYYNRGWIHVGVEGTTTSDKSPTQAQIDMLWDIYMAAFGRGNMRLMRHIKRYYQSHDIDLLDGVESVQAASLWD